jgi:hypothetical protein
MRSDDLEPRFDGTLAPNGTYGIPAVRTLSDEYRDEPEPVDSDREPRPEPPGTLHRVAAWLSRHRPGIGGSKRA